MCSFILLIVCCGLSFVNTARILGVFPTPSYSHQLVFQTIWKELSLRGHRVTVLTPSPLGDPNLTNLTEIDLKFSYDIWHAAALQDSINKEISVIESLRKFYALMDVIVEAQLENENVRKLITGSTTFDVLLVEVIHPTFFALGSRFSCPVIGVSSLGMLSFTHNSIGNPSHPILAPDFLIPHLITSNFLDRFYKVYCRLWINYVHYAEHLPRSDALARRYIKSDISYLGDIERNFSMIFLNVNPFFHPIRPNVPSIIELGNMNRNSDHTLPKDLQKELDEARQGFIYFSLGSNVKSANLSAELRETILSALADLPYKVLWKWESDQLPGKPANVVTRKWLPQQQILAHPNVKAFITQGGLQSMEEAVTNVVPMIGMPFFGDQPMNVNRMVQLGIAKSVDTETVTKTSLKEAIKEVAENPKYRKRIEEVSKLFNDQPMSGIEKAIWWTEYVIRHKGASHLRSPALDLPTYQYYLLDVIGFMLLVIMIITYVSYKIIRIAWCFVTNGNTIKLKSS